MLFRSVSCSEISQIRWAAPASFEIAIDLAGRVRTEISEPFLGIGCTPEEAIAATSRLLGEVSAALPHRDRIKGVSIAVPGFLAADGGTFHAAILGWHGVAIADLFRVAPPSDSISVTAALAVGEKTP